MTYSDKYALLKAYKIATGDDPDKEPSPTDNQFTIENEGNNLIDKNKLDAIKMLDLDPEKAKDVLKSFGYEKSTEIKVTDFARIFTALKSTKE